MLKGIHFVVDEQGRKIAVQIDLEQYGYLWEEMYDALIARARANEPRETMEAVRQRLLDQEKLDE